MVWIVFDKKYVNDIDDEKDDGCYDVLICNVGMSESSKGNNFEKSD